MNKSYVLRKIEDVVVVGETLSKSWFRGQPKCYSNLNPRVFRIEYQDPVYTSFRPDYELSMIEYFKRWAPSLEKDLPPYDDNLSWLLIMQHHGAPTRLLDWTESILIALFFAINQYLNEDGELWALYPSELNKLSNIDGLPTRENKYLQYLASEPFYQNLKKLGDMLGIQNPPQYPIAFEPPMNFFRIFVQKSVFTIHPKPENGNAIHEILDNPKHLVRYVIPSDCKQQFRKDLHALGIDYKYLFPDLDNLSKSLIYEHEIIAYVPPEPPKF